MQFNIDNYNYLSNFKYFDKNVFKFTRYYFDELHKYFGLHGTYEKFRGREYIYLHNNILYYDVTHIPFYTKVMVGTPLLFTHMSFKLFEQNNISFNSVPKELRLFYDLKISTANLNDNYIFENNSLIWVDKATHSLNIDWDILNNLDFNSTTVSIYTNTLNEIKFIIAFYNNKQHHLNSDKRMQSNLEELKSYNPHGYQFHIDISGFNPFCKITYRDHPNKGIIPTFQEYLLQSKSTNSHDDLADTLRYTKGAQTMGNYTITQPEIGDEKPEGLPIGIWKNPRPAVHNHIKLVKGDLCLIDNTKLLWRIDEIVDNNVTLSHVLEKDKFTKVTTSEVYPIFPVSDTYKIGDIILDTDSTTFSIVVRSPIILPTNHIVLRKIDPNANIVDLPKIATYSCGFIEETNTINNLPGLYAADYERTINQTYNVDYSYKKIAEHYKVQISDLIPKDNLIFDQLLNTLDHPINVESKEWALLVGPSGSGKSEMALRYADHHNKKYVKLQCTAQTTVDDLMGYKSITDGTYYPSLLREAVENGYLLILDEIDGLNPNTALALNGLKQSTFQFPDKLINVHPDFRLIGTANTLTYDDQYNSRNPLDMATIARFDVIQYGLTQIELSIRYGLQHITSISDIEDKTPREIERIVRKLQIKEQTNANSS